MFNKSERRSIDGILVLNKALNVSSNTALQQVKRLYNAKKAGHTGSLDPLATGVLPICLGEATKFSGYLLDADKTYTAWGRLGFHSSTGDAEGELVSVHGSPVISSDQFEKNLTQFLGTIKQIPPLYSALKKDGKPLYQLARRGKTLTDEEMAEKARWITIYDLQLQHYRYPDFEIKVTCSKGTYIRTLVEDVGKSFDSAAYLTNLRREKAGPYLLEKALTLEQLAEYDVNSLDTILLPIDTAVLDYPALTLDSSQVTALRQGKSVNLVQPFALTHESLIRLYDTYDLFLGLGYLSIERQLRVQRLIAW